MSEMNFDTFTDVLRYLQMNTSLNARQIKTLICVGYFSGLGKTGKLMAVFDEFFEGKNKLTKQIKSYEKRLAINRQFESNQPDIALPIFETVRNENDLLGLCMSVEQSQPDNVYFVEEVEDKYGIKAKLYSISRGSSGLMKVSKRNYNASVLAQGNVIVMDQWKKRQRSVFKDGKRVPLGDEFDFWLEKYHNVA